MDSGIQTLHMANQPEANHNGDCDCDCDDDLCPGKSGNTDTESSPSPAAVLADEPRNTTENRADKSENGRRQTKLLRGRPRFSRGRWRGRGLFMTKLVSGLLDGVGENV